VTSDLVNVSGLRELNDALTQLPARIAKNTLRGGVNAAASVFVKEARALAPESTGPVSEGHPPPGTLKRAIYRKQIAEKSGVTEQTFYIGVRSGKNYRDTKRGNLDAYYAKWVEYGHVATNGRIVPAQPFMRTAFSMHVDDAINAMRDYLSERIPREISELGFIR
jgi:HK97 gp10 family phage protein